MRLNTPANLFWIAVGALVTAIGAAIPLAARFLH
jgi:hypothetical protein